MKEIKKIHPDTIIQPNRVTMMRYALKPLEENVFTLLMDKFRAELYDGVLMDRNLWGEPVLKFDLREISPSQNPANTYNSIKEIKQREFEYTYIRDGKKVEINGIIFPTVTKENNYIELKVNTDALPWLFWFGGNTPGKTFFNKTVALTLSGGHAKRIYKMLSSWKSRGGWVVKIEEFKRMLCVNHELGNLKKFVLEPAKEELHNNENSDIWFEYKTDTSNELKEQGGRGRKPHDIIIFKIYTRYKSQNEQIEALRKGVTFEHFNEIFKFLQNILGATNYKALEITDACTDEGDRFCKNRYRDLKGLRNKGFANPQAFNYFMSTASKESDNKIFDLRFKDCKS